MTRGSKYFTLFLVQAGLLSAAAYGGGRFVQKKYLDSCQSQRAELVKQAVLMTGRERLMEAEVGALFGNYPFAFERMVAGRLESQRAGLKLDREFDEAQNLLIAQSPDVKVKLLTLADKIKAIPLSFPPPSASPTPAPQTPSPQAQPAVAATPRREINPEIRTETKPEIKPDTKTDPRPSPRTESSDMAAGHKALLDAKVALISGDDMKTTVQKLAQARVMLDEAGRAELDAEVDDVIDAVRHKDEGRARTGLDGLLKRLRGQ